MAMSRLLSITLAVLIALPGIAQAAEDDGSCRNGMFAEENSEFGLARIKGPGKAYFHSDMDGCPTAGQTCKSKTFVIAGDRVVTGRSQGDFDCVYFPNKLGGTAGWVEKSHLLHLPVNRAPPLAAWVGNWSDSGNPFVGFAIFRGKLRVDGESYWPSPNPDPRDRPGGPNMGQIGGLVSVKGNRAYEEECAISFVLLGDILVAADPGRECDGMNVTFSGIYQRRKR